MDNEQLLGFQTVQHWLKGLEEHWGGNAATDDPERLPLLAEFCQFAKADPDAIIAACLRVDKAGDKRISIRDVGNTPS